MSDESSKALGVEELLSELGKGGAAHLQEFLDTHPELISKAIVEQICELVRHKVRVDADEAMRLSEAALMIAGRLSDHASFGRGLRAKANALWFKGNCKAAVELFDRAVIEFEDAGMAAEVGRTLSSSIQALVLLGDYDRASDAAAKARNIFLTLGDHWRRARLELNFANIHHRQDRFADALAAYEHAYEELLPYKDAEGIGVALHNMAVCLIMLNDFDRALGCYGRVGELCRNNGMPQLELQADYNIAYLYFLRGDYNTAIEGLTRTHRSSREHGDAYHSALCDLDQSEIYLELNLTEEAARIAGDARRQFEALGMGFETGRSVANLAIASHRRSDSARALELFADARIIFEQEKNEAWQALINLYQAIVLCELRNYDEARDICLEARAFFQSAGLERREILCDLLLSRLSLQTGDAAAANSRCHATLQRLKAIKAPLLAFQAYLLLGHAERISDSPKAAYQSYNNARSELEKLRSSVQGEELKISFLKDKIDVYQSLVEVCLEPNLESTAETVFRLIEQAKSRGLAEMVFGSSRRITLTETAGDSSERMEALKGELNWLYHRLELEQTSRDGISIERIKKLHRETRDKEDEFVRIVREQDVLGAPSGVLDRVVPLELEEIRAALYPDAVVVEYFQTSTEFVAAVIDLVSVEIIQLAPLQLVKSHIGMLEFQLSKFRLNISYSNAFQSTLLAATQNRLRELYRDLIEPLCSRLTGRHITVVPHGILHYVPFHALFDGSRYLIDRFTISYAPSATVYAMCEQRSANPHGGSLLMGVQDENAPYIEREIQSVASVVPEPAVYLGKSATAEVLRSRGPQSSIIHIATHGFFRRDNAMFSSVRLADSYLSLYDLYELRLPVELLTLSGCGTGLSVVAAGDELLGLTRGLLYAGAQSLLLSLWDVHDETTAEFMASFYTHLQRDHEKRIALQAAMWEVREHEPHPYFWAPFALVGKAFNG